MGHELHSPHRRVADFTLVGGLEGASVMMFASLDQEWGKQPKGGRVGLTE